MKEISINIKRLLSLFLAILILFTTIPLTSYGYTDGAGGSPVNGGGGGGNSSTAGGGIREPRFPDTYEFIKS